MYPFERFTERAKRVLTLAQEEAERGNLSYIGTEHLLIGLLREGDGLAAIVLKKHGVALGQVRGTIAAMLGRNERIIVQQIIPTSRVKKVIELAFEEARRMDNNYVGTEHILLALMEEGEGIAAHVLRDLGVTLDKLRPEIDAMLKDNVDAADVAAAQEAFYIWLQVGSRVLYHDPDPPYRLWEGKVTGHDTSGDPPTMKVTVVIEGHPQTPQVSVPAGDLHRIPLISTAGCSRCQHGRIT